MPSSQNDEGIVKALLLWIDFPSHAMVSKYADAKIEIEARV